MYYIYVYAYYSRIDVMFNNVCQDIHTTVNAAIVKLLRNNAIDTVNQQKASEFNRRHCKLVALHILGM